MTFSDAEDDQPSRNHVGNSTSTEDQISPNGNSVEQAAQAPLNNPLASESTQGTLSVQNERSASGVAGINETSNSLNTHSSGESISAPNEDNSISASASQTAAPIANSNTSGRSVSEQVMDAAQAVIQEAEQDTSKSLSSERILQKLQQIQSYIHQTTAAMENLEQEGDLTKISQYNTLAKVVRELKNSQLKLIAHLTKLKAKSDEEKSVEVQEPCRNSSGQQKSGSEMVGVVSVMEGELPLPTMREELQRHNAEQEQLALRLRESVTRRQDLMARYRNTRERLNALKNQRTSLAQQERRILMAEGANENPYEDPVPGADTWSLEQLRSSQSDFRVLADKVNRLEAAYKAKNQATPASEGETIEDTTRKLEQLTDKRMQINLALRQLADLEKLRMEEAEGGLVDESVPTVNVTNQPNLSNLTTPIPPVSNPITTNSTLPANTNTDPSDSTVNIQRSLPQPQPELEIPRDSELEARKEYLAALETQLSTMKNLLQESKQRQAAAQDYPNVDSPDSSQDNINVETRPEILAESAIVGLSGGVINLSETERRDPAIIQKYRQLSDAKSRLSKMETVMATIAQASQAGKRVEEVLSPTSLQLLREARAEYQEDNSENVSPRRSQPPDDSHKLSLGTTGELVSAKEKLSQMQDLLLVISEAAASGQQLDDVLTKEQIEMIEGTSEYASEEPNEESVNEVSNQRNNADDINNVGFRPIEPAFSRLQPQSNLFQHQQLNSRVGAQQRQISTDWDTEVQQEFEKAASGISNVNGGRNKDSSMKDGNSRLIQLAKYDYNPHLVEVAKLQEELAAKKNNLDSLMQQLGKGDSDIDLSSSNVDVVEPSISRSRSKESYRSDDDLVDSSYSNARTLYASSQIHNVQQRADSMPPVLKNQIRPDNSNQTVNNLSVRPKQNELRGSSIPSTRWEGQGHVPPPKSPNTAAQVHNTVSSALLQLNQVQDSINHLCENLKQGKMLDAFSSSYNSNVNSNAMPVNNMAHLNPVNNRNVNNIYSNNANTNPNLNLNTMNDFNATPTSNVNALNHASLNNSSSANNLPGCYDGMNPMQGYGMASNPQQIGPVNNQPIAQAPQNPLLQGLQQCFSQLQLQSMEIQALSKGMQVRPQLVPTSYSSNPGVSYYPPPSQYPPISTPYQYPTAMAQQPQSSQFAGNPPNYPNPAVSPALSGSAGPLQAQFGGFPPGVYPPQSTSQYTPQNPPQYPPQNQSQNPPQYPPPS